MLFTYYEGTPDLVMTVIMKSREADTHLICSTDENPYWWTEKDFVVRMNQSKMHYSRDNIKRVVFQDIGGTEYAKYAEVK